MTWILVGFLLVALVATLVGVTVMRARAFGRDVRRQTRAVLRGARGTGLDKLSGTFTALPEPIRRYLVAVGAHRLCEAKAVRIKQRGTFWLRGRWQPFTATQLSTLWTPGFLWDATIRMGPGLHVRVIDSYIDGEGELDARLLGALPVAHDAGSRALNCGELSRYLAEAPLYPLALLPGRGVLWGEEEGGWARATLSHAGNTVSLRFHVGDDNLIDIVEGLRYRATDTGAEQTLWRGRFWDYGTSEDGVRVPQRGEVAWVLAGGEQPYWRGRLEGVKSVLKRRA